MIKVLLSYLERDLKWGKYFTFWITSSVGWRIKEKLFQPYQIQFLKETGEEEFVEDKVVNSHELAYVDEKNCWAQCLINLFDRAKELTQQTF